MALTEAQKAAVVDRAVEILRAPDRKERIAALREKVLARNDRVDEADDDDALYAVLQALEEIYG